MPRAPRDESPAPGSPPPPALGFAGAAGGAVLGVIVWVVAATALHGESGFVALLAGALVGTGARLLRGRGALLAATAAILVPAAILVGHGFAYPRVVEARLRAEEAAVDRTAYDRMDRAARDWAKGVKEEDVPRFAYDHGFVVLDTADEVHREMDAFRAKTIPEMEAWARKAPPFEEWQERERVPIRESFASRSSYGASLSESATPFDLILWVVGAGLAGFLARGKDAALIRRSRTRGGRRG